MQENNNYWSNNWKSILGFTALIAVVFSMVLYVKKKNQRSHTQEASIKIIKEEKRTPIVRI